MHAPLNIVAPIIARESAALLPLVVLIIESPRERR